jgi:hypothetical protein
MLTQLAELAKAKQQASLTLRHLEDDRYLLAMAASSAGNDKKEPLITKGTIEEIQQQLGENIAQYIADMSKAPELEKAPPKQKAAAKKKTAPKPKEEQKCRVCGCTDSSPCPDGCSWVEKDLCSACQGKEEKKTESASQPDLSGWTF